VRRREQKKQTEENLKYVKITYLTKREIKILRRGDFMSKLIQNHPSLMDQGV